MQYMYTYVVKCLNVIHKRLQTALGFMKLVLFSRYSNTASKYLVFRNARLCVLQNIALQVRRDMRKLTFCICESKGTDQLRGSRAGDERLCFRYIDSTIPLLPKSKISSLYPSSQAIHPV